LKHVQGGNITENYEVRSFSSDFTQSCLALCIVLLLFMMAVFAAAASLSYLSLSSGVSSAMFFNIKIIIISEIILG